MAPHKEQIEIGKGYKEKYGFHVEEKSVFKSKKGLNHDVIDQISDHKNEPDWMRAFRHKALDIFLAKPMPTWGGDLSHLNFDEIYYYLKPAEHKGDTWEDVPEEIKRTFDKLGIPESEQKFLAGSGAQYESESVYHKLKDEWESKGVIFLDTDSALREHEDLLKQYFATIVPPDDNKFAALNSAVWSGGSFLYVPPGVHVDLPLQAYFRINAKNVGQFERTLLICDEGAQAHYVEGCFTKGTKIWANPSHKNIEEIQKGERVLTHTGEYKPVYHVQSRRYDGELYCIEYGDTKQTLEVTAEHPFIVVPKNKSAQNWKWEWKTVRSLQEGDHLAIPMAIRDNFKPHALSYADKHFAYLPIKKIAKRAVKNLTVYNFGVEGDESYVAGGVAVHNCTAPSYSSDSLHAAVVEVIVKKNARFRYTTIQNWSSNVYNLVTKRAQAFKDSTMEWVDANLGCLSGDSKIFLNPKGPVPISEIQPGDHVYAVDLNELKPRRYRVNAVRQTGIKKTYRLTTQNFREVKATANHPFLTLARNNYSAYPKLSWQPLENLKEGSLIAMLTALPDEGKSYKIEYTYQQIKGRGLKNIPSLPKETNEDLLWFLGLYLGDGYIERAPKTKRPRRVYFAVPPKDRARARLTKIIEKQFNVNWKPKAICVTIGSAVLADWILYLGFDGTAKSKSIPAWIFSLPLRQKLSFIEGYLDADGHVRNNSKDFSEEKGQITFASANKKLLEEIKLLMISCGLNPLKISTYAKERALYKGQWKQYTTHYLTLNLKENLRRIREKTPNESQIQFTRVRSIEPLLEEPVYDIEVEGAHNFIANGLIVHNSKLTMKYPSIYLMEPGARGDILSVAYAGKSQHQDAGGKVVHVAPRTSSHVLSKSVSQNGGRSSYRGLVKVYPKCKEVKVNVCCDALIMDKDSRSDTYPYMEIDEKNVSIGHEATVSKIGDEQLFYLRSRGLSEEQANSMIVSGFIEPIVKELPMEYAVEMNRLIQLQMEGSVG